MIYILYFALLYLGFTSLVLIRNLFQFKRLKDVQVSEFQNSPKVSICIPARNEEKNIRKCVESCLSQNYQEFEVLVLDDGSTDQTPTILNELQSKNDRLIVLRGSKKPENWLGKPWACHQISERAQGDILVFIDADVWLEPETLAKTVHILQSVDMLTVWPHQQMKGFWENLIIPSVYFTLFTLLPAVYVERSPRWLPRFLLPKLEPQFVAANGQFLAFRRLTYLQTGGHTTAQSAIVDDMAIAKKVKASGFRLKMISGFRQVYCRMYTSHSEIWTGFRKNFLVGFESLSLFIIMGILHFLVFLFPLITLLISWQNENTNILLLSGLILLLIIKQRLIIQRMFNWSITYSLIHPISVLWFQFLGIQCLLDLMLNIKPSWKGRKV